jgi:predicted lipoprotein with Yx(FWY)xxD motif
MSPIYRRSNRALRASVGLFGVAALTLVACAKSSPPSSGSSAPSNALVAVQTERVSGIGAVLANGTGLTMYYNTREKGGKIVCTGSCVSTWPPVVVTGAVPQATAGIKGSFATIARPDGTTQLTFDGWPLYTYSGDTSSGTAAGQGIEKIWFAMGATGLGSSGSGGASGGSRYGGSSGSGSSSGGYGTGGYGS